MYRKILKKAIIILMLIQLLTPWQIMPFPKIPVQTAKAATTTITNRVDFNTGFYDQAEGTTQLGSVNLKGSGTWNVRLYRQPYTALGDGSAVATDGVYTYLLVARDIKFTRYLPKEDRWQNLADAPHTSYSGGDMVRIGNYIYVMYGGYQKEFSRYSIVDNTWVDLIDLPDLIFSGGSLETDGTNIYALRGANTIDFYKYTVSANAWTVLNGPPATVSNGADLVYDNSTGTPYLYTPRGANTTTFYRYTIGTNIWTTMPAVIPIGLNSNGNITKKGDFIYVMRGSATNSMYRYQISTDTWITISTVTPQTTQYVGMIYNPTDDLISLSKE